MLEGLKPDPSKVEMRPPTDVKGLKRFLGMVNYLAKFLPRLYDLTEPCRKLENKKVEWCWLEQHRKAFHSVKHYLAEALCWNTTISVKRLRFNVIQARQVWELCSWKRNKRIAFESRALTDTGTRYAQIEKYLLAILWSTNKFNQHILGREVVHVESLTP